VPSTRSQWLELLREEFWTFLANVNSRSLKLVPNSVTLDDLERRNSSNRLVISPNSVAFWKRRYFLQRKCSPKNLVFSDRSFTLGYFNIDDICRAYSEILYYSICSYIATKNLYNLRPRPHNLSLSYAMDHRNFIPRLAFKDTY